MKRLTCLLLVSTLFMCSGVFARTESPNVDYATYSAVPQQEVLEPAMVWELNAIPDGIQGAFINDAVGMSIRFNRIGCHDFVYGLNIGVKTEFRPTANAPPTTLVT